MRLSNAKLGSLPSCVVRPDYDHTGQAAGIVHLGIGAFHRAHMAVYTDDAMNGGEVDWGILGVSLRSPAVAGQLNPQNGLYTLSERSADGSKLRLISAVKHVIVAKEQPELAVSALAAPTTHIVSLTITEKGYCRTPDGSLDLELADSNSAYAYLAKAFARRRNAGLPGLTLLSCDNLARNGSQLEHLLTEYLAQHAPELTDWFTAHCACPSTMIDRIVPATTVTDRNQVAKALGMRDEAAVITEPFSQWVIEDKFAGPRPSWENYGVNITRDVEPFETAKLRMLNGAHSAMAYLGLQHGHTFVHQAIADAGLARLIEKLMREEAAMSVSPGPGQNLSAYADRLIERFRNPALNHRLIQIAMDGSQKIPQRWLETLAFHQKRGRQCPAILAAIAGWLRHIRGDNKARLGSVDDPMAARLGSIWDEAGEGGIIDAIFGKAGPLASDWTPGVRDKTIIDAGLRGI